MTIPTEPIGSIPRPVTLINAVASGEITDPSADEKYVAAVNDTIEQFEATGPPIITDGEHRKFDNFCTYSVHGLEITAPDGFNIPFATDHTIPGQQTTR